MTRYQRGEVITGYVVGGLVLLIIVLGAVMWFDHRELKREVAAAQDKVTAAEKQLGKEEESRKGFQNAAGSCSASIDRLVIAQSAREARYRGELEASRKATAKAEESARSILASHRPAGMTECDAMKKELDDEIDRRHPAR